MPDPWSPDITKLLQMCGELADRHKFSHLAVMMIGRDVNGGNGQALVGHAGEVRMADEVLREIHKSLIPKLEKYVKERERPPRDFSLGLDYVCYNMGQDPLCFDFLTWLINSEMTRRRYGLPAPLKVGFCGPLDDRARMWLNNVFKPCMKFLGAIEDPDAAMGHSSNYFASAPICEAARNGEAVPILQPPHTIDTNAVTITLRECTDHESERNSNLPEWLRFADYLQERNERVIFVRDTEKATEPLIYYETWPDASTDLEARMALYQGAKINLFVSNGPCGLAIYSNRPYLIFIKPDDRTNSPKFWQQHLGIKIGEQFPWAGPLQRIVWSGDTYPELVKAWAAISEELNGVPSNAP